MTKRSVSPAGNIPNLPRMPADERQAEKAVRQALVRPPTRLDMSKLGELVTRRDVGIATRTPCTRIEASMR